MALSSPTRLAGQVELDYDDPYLRIQFPAAQAHTPPTPPGPAQLPPPESDSSSVATQTHSRRLRLGQPHQTCAIRPAARAGAPDSHAAAAVVRLGPRAAVTAVKGVCVCAVKGRPGTVSTSTRRIGGRGGQCHDQSLHARQCRMFYHHDRLARDRQAYRQPVGHNGLSVGYR